MFGGNLYNRDMTDRIAANILNECSVPIKMPNSESAKMKIGSILANDDKEKIILIAHDFATDKYIAYNYYKRTEEVLPSLWLKSWETQVAFEDGIFSAMKENIEHILFHAFSEERKISEGTRSAFNVLGEPYATFNIGVSLKVVNRASLTNAMNRLHSYMKKKLLDNKIDEIEFRSYPELSLVRNCVTGERFINSHTRLICKYSGVTIDVWTPYPEIKEIYILGENE